MLFEYIERVRKKPREVRQQHALFLSIAITGCIAIIWLSTLVISGEPRAQAPEQEVTQEAVNTGELFKASNTFSNQFNEQSGSGAQGPNWAQQLPASAAPALEQSAAERASRTEAVRNLYTR